MPVSTVSDICRGGLQALGKLGSGQTMNADDGVLALELLNGLLDQWRGEGLLIYFATRTVKAITANDGSYTVGSGGDVDIVRPVFIDDVRLIDTAADPDLETPLTWLTDAAYRAIAQKALTNTQPSAWWYNPTFSTARGTLELWPVPTGSNLSFALYAPTAVATYTALTDSFSLPPGYERMLRTNLALEMAAPFQAQPSPWLIEAARDSMASVKRGNIKRNMTDLRIEPGALIGSERGFYDVYSDRNL